jgi:hypothetical protein
MQKSMESVRTKSGCDRQDIVARFKFSLECAGNRMADRCNHNATQTYSVLCITPRDLDTAELSACVAMIESGEAVDPESAAGKLPLCTTLAVAKRGDEIVGVGAIKRVRLAIHPELQCGVAKSCPQTLRCSVIS